MKILTKFNKFLGRSKESNRFSEFFTKSSSRERVKVLRNAAREANKDQRDLVEKYEKEYYLFELR